MNLAHIHLLLNHFPTVGFIVGLGVFLLSLVRKNEELKRVSLAVFVAVALLTIPTYVSGRAAEDAIVKDAGVSRAMIDAHQDAALWGFALMMITGAFAWTALWQYRRNAAPTRALRWNLSAVLVLSVLNVAVMARAADIGGAIRHPEILTTGATPGTDGTDGTDGEAVVAPPGWFSTERIADFVNTTPWVWSALESLHFIGLSLLFGAVTLVNLRMLGLLKNASFAGLDILPVGMLGFGINIVTGMMFFIATPGQYTQNIAFHWKMLFLLLAGASFLYLVVIDEVWTLKPGDDAPARVKVVAASTIVLWVGVLYMGRMLPFLGNSF